MQETSCMALQEQSGRQILQALLSREVGRKRQTASARRSETPRPQGRELHFFEYKEHIEALERLRYSIESEEKLAILTGEIGAEDLHQDCVQDHSGVYQLPSIQRRVLGHIYIRGSSNNTVILKRSAAADNKNVLCLSVCCRYLRIGYS